MGCDIHVCVEKRSSSTELWESYDSTDVEYVDAIEIGRDYVLFSLLAGVRNHFGFVPVAPPRGLPPDVSAEVANAANDEWGSDGHSHSWVTLAELEAANLQTQRVAGYITLRSYRKWRTTKEPIFEWADDPEPFDGMRVPLQELALLARSDANTLDGSVPYSRVPGAVCVPSHTQTTLFKLLAALRKVGDPADVRIVFWFDN